MTPSYKPGVNEHSGHFSTSSDFNSEENNVMSFGMECAGKDSEGDQDQRSGITRKLVRIQDRYK